MEGGGQIRRLLRSLSALNSRILQTWVGSKNASNKVSYCNVIAIYSISSTIIFFCSWEVLHYVEESKNIRKYLMLDIFYFSKLKTPGFVVWVDKLTTVDCWSSSDVQLRKVCIFIFWLYPFSLLNISGQWLSHQSICCDGIVRGESYLGPWVFPMPSGSELLIFNVHSISGFFVKGSDIVGLVQFLSFLFLTSWWGKLTTLWMARS